MREEIRLGNDAITQGDLETARQHFQQLLASGGTPLQERIAENRLREIQEKMEALLAPAPAKPRARRKTAAKKAETGTGARKVIRPPDKPVVVIRKH